MIPDTQTTPDPVKQGSGQPETNPAGGGLAEAPSIGPKPSSRQLQAGRRSIAVSQALAMLRLLPVHATSVPRVHIGPRQPDGTLRILDRFTGQQLIVYTPRFAQQFRAGHCSGRWYVRPVTHVGTGPVSGSYSTARAAIEAVTAGYWSSRSSCAAGPRRLRVICPVSEACPSDASRAPDHLGRMTCGAAFIKRNGS